MMQVVARGHCRCPNIQLIRIVGHGFANPVAHQNQLPDQSDYEMYVNYVGDCKSLAKSNAVAQIYGCMHSRGRHGGLMVSAQTPDRSGFELWPLSPYCDFEHNRKKRGVPATKCWGY